MKKILGDLRMSRPCRSYSSTGQHDVVTMLLVAVRITVVKLVGSRQGTLSDVYSISEGTFTQAGLCSKVD